MKTGVKLSLFFVGLLVLAGVLVRHYGQRDVFLAEDLAEIAMIKEAVLENRQRIDDPAVAKHVIEKLAGNEKVLDEYFNETLKGMEALFVEIRTAMSNGNIEVTFNRYSHSYLATIETSTEYYISISSIEDDGRFRQCSKRSLLSEEGKKIEAMRFYEDKKTLQLYRGSHGSIVFDEDGTLNSFVVVIDGKTHEISWDVDGKLVGYRVLDVR